MHSRVFTIAVALTVAACDSPTPRYLNGSSAEVEIAGSRFVVFRNGVEVEAYRVSREDRPSEQKILLRAGFAMEAVSGCKISPGSMTGDQAIVRATLQCGAQQLSLPAASVTIHGAPMTCVTISARPFPKDWLPQSETNCVIEALGGGW